MNRASADERGASLIMVILFVTVFAVIIGAILNFASTGFRVTSKIVDIRDQEHAVEGAMDGAINAVRGSESALVSGPRDCFQLPADANGAYEQVVVTCDQSTPGGIFDETPAWAILALGTASGEGINKDKNEPMFVSGSIFSHGWINIMSGSNSTISVTGDAYARGNCNRPNDIIQSGQKVCNFGSAYPSPAVQARSVDPNLPTAVPGISGLPVDPPATCVFGNTIVKFVPGVYTEHLINLVPTGPSGCASAKTWWLSPAAPSANTCPTGLGVYYFNFEESTPWVIQDGDASVVAGSLPTCSNGAPTAAPVWPISDDPVTVPPCLESGPGAQLIFGGKSRVVVHHGNYASNQNGRLAVCTSDASTTSQKVAFIGLKSGSRPPVPSADFATLVDRNASAWDTPTAFTNPEKAFATDGQSARATFVGGGGVSPATLKVRFDEAALADIPAGSRINKATVKALFSTNSPPSKPVGIGVTWRRNTGSDIPCATPGAGCDITALLKPAGGKYHYRNFNDIASITLTATPPALTPAIPTGCDTTGRDCTGVIPAEQATVDVDAMILQVNYTPPGFEAHVPETDTECAGGAAILKSCTNPVTLFKGTVYAPTARVSIEVHNKNSTDFGRGAIARTFDLDVSASTEFEKAPFSLPSTTPSRRVLFTAKVNGRPKLRALVRYTDKKPGVSGTYPGYKATVLGWAVLR